MKYIYIIYIIISATHPSLCNISFYVESSDGVSCPSFKQIHTFKKGMFMHFFFKIAFTEGPQCYSVLCIVSSSLWLLYCILTASFLKQITDSNVFIHAEQKV